MITSFSLEGAQLRKSEGALKLAPQTVWIDLLNPTPEEDAFVEGELGISIPTRAETREIEASNRLYQENGAAFMTAFIVYNLEALMPSTSTLTFILAGSRLVTVRYSEPKAIPIFLARVEKGDLPCNSAAAILLGLLETLIHRQADLIERIQDEVEKTAHAVFEIKGGQQTRGRRLDVLLKAAGKEGDITSRAQESAFSLDRLLTYLTIVLKERQEDPRLLERVAVAQRDVSSLIEHMRFLTGRIGFLLDATLGMINHEQNSIIKIFSVAAVALMPPTLIASIYGMNFKHMPELEWTFGYPLALLLMVVSAVVPFFYFRRKGWF
jgi:magnesium transporter